MTAWRHSANTGNSRKSQQYFCYELWSLNFFNARACGNVFLGTIFTLLSSDSTNWSRQTTKLVNCRFELNRKKTSVSTSANPSWRIYLINRLDYRTSTCKWMEIDALKHLAAECAMSSCQVYHPIELLSVNQSGPTDCHCCLSHIHIFEVYSLRCPLSSNLCRQSIILASSSYEIYAFSQSRGIEN